jgi:heme-degrading monooxygenase HmoA
MIALLFEVKPAPGQLEPYLAMAAALKPRLLESGGCDFIDRYQSRTRPGWYLSYQLWRDEAALTRWRVHGEHHQAQNAGREAIFADYQLRVLQVLRVESPGKPAWTTQRLNSYNDPAITPPRTVSLTEREGGSGGMEFESLYRPGHFVQIDNLASYAAALDASEQCLVDASVTYRIAEVQRAYGMFDRREAPTYYPPVSRTP